VTSALIRGEGIAATCCARLLKRAGIPYAVERAERSKLPAIMLGEATQKLLHDVFDRTDLFDALPKIRKRVVVWGADAHPVVVPHSAVVVSEQAILDRLRPAESDEVTEAAWTIFTSRPLPEPAREHHFGERTAAVSTVKLKSGSDREGCWIESLDHGWLFLLPAEDDAWLLSVGGPADSLLGESRFIANQITGAGVASGTFPCHPRIVEPLCAPRWLACGTAALGFDPLCGEGVGYATREAILASAVIRAAADGADVDALVAHYRTRLLAGFRKHLEVCRDFYAAGRGRPWWDQELGSLERGLEWCASQIHNADAFRFRLRGFALEPVN
jgi:hypothetical protein